MKSVALIDPGSKRTLINETIPSVGLASIAAVLENHGWTVRVLDWALARPAEVESFLLDTIPVWGISVTSFTFHEALKVADAIKRANKDRVVVVGGPHVSIAMEGILGHSLIDYAIYGEGEFSLLELVELLERSPNPSAEECAGIKGLIYRRDGGVKVNAPRPRLTALDALPFPAYRLFDMSRHDNYPLLTSRGCPYGCSFCAIKTIWGTAWHARSPENLVDEIEHAYQKYDLDRKIVNIIDDAFNVDPKRALRFCELLSARGLKIRWFAWGVRADRMTPELARSMQSTGCIGVSVGVESADDDVLRAMGKRETLAEIEHGISQLTAVGLPICGTFMIGNIGDTMRTVTKTFAFAKGHPFVSLFFYLALPYPKTELYEYAKKHGRFLCTDYTRFHHFSSQPVFETPEFTAEERVRAYKLSRKLVARMRLRAELKSKFLRLKNHDFSGLTWRRVSKAWQRIEKHGIDFLTGRGDQT